MTALHPLRLGLIGAGRWSRSYLRTAAALPDVQIVRVARQRAQLLDPPFEGIEVTTDWRQVAEARDLHGVVVATPPHFHTEPALAALRAGHAVIIEKPMTMSVPEARTLLEAARAAHVPVLVEHTHLFSPAFRALCSSRPAGLVRIESLSGNRGTFRPDCSSLWDWGSHDVAMALTVAGERPGEIKARRVAHEETPEGPGDLFEITLAFPSGSRARLTFGNILTARTRRLLVESGNERWLYDDWSPPRLFHAPAGQTVQSAPGPTCLPVPGDDTLPLTVALREFAAAIRTGRADTDSVALGLSVVEILAEAERQVGATA